ncbi:MAG: NUDIX domain-containing protein [Chloroflexi bacterium]|uniref:NUDIX domain-containing protein n=1 Tax=Candidatus Chlorohelix allophototropha TaxID=3003348 RepID=A0A8T7LYE2_9CHLR|nr:NUDIX domain-containing protein [Chloroflexota bacterium]WJW67808.1 NUDIX domain-containing protein [Chloroflexota bacterium L227-S17]
MMKIKEVLNYASPEEAQQAGEHIQAVIIVPFHSNGIVLCRNRWRGWEFPGGGVEWRESVYSAAGRELVEETGAEFSSLEFVQVLWLERNIYRSLKIALFYAEVTQLNAHHDFYEILEVKLFNKLPSPRLLSYECEDEIYQIALDAYQKAA